jgi:hypothetical protein
MRQGNRFNKKIKTRMSLRLDKREQIRVNRVRQLRIILDIVSKGKWRVLVSRRSANKNLPDHVGEF